MPVDWRIIVFIILQLSMGIAAAEMEAVTKDGKRVRLLDDQTWAFIDNDDVSTIAAKISIEVTSKTDRQGKCIFGLRLHNNAGFNIASLVPQFTAHVKNDVKYENLFVGFQRIKPTQNQYKELAFSRIACAEITRITVHGGDRCAMAELTKYSPEKGECLKHVEIRPSQLVKIAK
ncbi:MAG: hypothetical protein ACI8W7_002884 [Gammaproteobacteria bacterium]|jgi:hypothetical protein